MGSLKYHLFIRFIGVIILQIAFMGLFAWFYFEQNFQHTLDANFEVLTSVKRSIEHFYEHQIEEFQRMSQGKDFLPYNREKASRAVEDYIHIRGITSTVHYYRPDGHLEFWASSYGVKDYTPEGNVRDHREEAFKKSFAEALSTGTLTFTPPLYTKNKIFYHVALIPVFDAHKKIQGLLSLAFFPDASRQNHAFDGLSLSTENFLVMSDSSGNVQSSSDVDSKTVGPVVSHYIRHRGPTPQDPYSYVRKEFKDLKYKVNNSSYYLLSRRIGKMPLFVVVGINENVFESQKKRLLDFILAITGISTLIGLAASIFVSRNTTKATAELLAAIKDVRLGRTHKKRDLKLHREFKEALDELDELSIDIQKGKLLGNLWGQDSLSRDAKKDR